MPQFKNNSFGLVSILSVITFLASVIFFLKFRDYPFLAFMQESNIVLYGCSLLVFALSFIAFTAIFAHCRGAVTATNRLLDKPLGKRAAILLFSLLLACVSVLLLHRRFVAELSEFAILFYSDSIHDLPLALGISVCLAAGIACLLLFVSGRDIPGFVVWPCYILAAVACFLSTLTINIIAADTHHGVAYLESIFNVYYGAPYNAETMGVYGHYGIFFGLALRLLDKGIVTLSVMIAGIAAAVSLCCSYILHSLTKRNWLRIVGTLSCSFTVLTLRVNNYYQVQPHRIIFPILLLSLLIWQCKHNRWGLGSKFFDYIVVALAILWNTESGLFCMIGLTGALTVQSLLSNKLFSYSLLKDSIIHIILCLFSLFSAIGIEILYNRLCFWYDFDIKLFFAPLFLPNYMDGILRADMPIQNSAWIYVLVLFAGLLLLSLRDTTLFSATSPKDDNGANMQAPFLSALAIFGLLNFSYYANRAAYYNLDIVMQLAALALCYLANTDRSRFIRLFASGESVVHTLQHALSAVCMVILAALFIQSIIFCPNLLKTKYESGHWNTQSIRTICNEIQQHVPKDTYAFGPAISIYYQTMHWDTQGHYTDFSDLSVYGDTTRNKIIEEAAKRGSFLATSVPQEIIDKILEKNPSLELAWSATVEDLTLQYWCEGSVV